MTDIDMDAHTGPRRRITGRTVLLALLGFFGVIMLVNGVFVYLALGSFSGLTTEQAYKKGLDYNRQLQADEAQRALGWQATVEARWAGVDRATPITVTLRDRDGVPLPGLAVTGELRRPVEAESDLAVSFSAVGEGHYTVEALLPHAGNWDLLLTAEDGQGASLRITRRLWLTSSR